MLEDDDDDFLYGSSKDVPEAVKQPVATTVPQPISLETARSVSQGLVATLEEQAASAEDGTPEVTANEDDGTPEVIENGNGDVAEEDAEGDREEEDESDDDIEIIMEQPSRSLDLRQTRPAATRTASVSTPTRPAQPQPSLTTEYTPLGRGGTTKLSGTPQPTSTTPLPALSATPGPTQNDVEEQADSGPDPSTLPPATAPPSHPSINPELPGTLDGRSILEVDLSALAEKPWRRPGSDVSDWFNYGFDEISWEAYCYRRRELGELAGVLKSNVLNFAGMPEEQLTALPPEIRSMVMAGATAMMANGGGPGGPGMIPPGGGMGMNGGALMNQMMNMGPMMNPMMEMGGMGMNGEMGMGMGPGMQMGGGMGGAQGMPGGPQGMGGGGMMQEGQGQGMGAGQPGGQGAPEGQMGMGDGFGPGGPGAGQGMMGMGMGGDFPMQDQNGVGLQMGQQMGQQMYTGADGSSGTPAPAAPTPTRAPSGPGAGQFRGGRGMQPGMSNMRGGARGGFAGRGRGMPVRPASPLPPNVPTGPRNKNKYKDIDGSAPAVDGLDYGGGGGGKETTRGTPDHDDRERSSRKRRGSPSVDRDRDDGRTSKRR